MKAVICGGGIAGLALAQRLDSLGWGVVVLERARGPRAQGYMIDFFGLGYDAAESMGALPRIQELGHQVDEASYLDEKGRRRAGLNYARFAKAIDGRMLSIMRPDLEQALREQLSDRVDLRFSSSPAQVEQSADTVRVTLTDGSTLDADLLVGADGIHSTIRHMLFGEEEQFVRYLGFHTAAYVFEDARVFAEVRGRFCLTDSVDRQMGFYGLRDGRVAAFAVHRAPDPALPEDPQAALREVYGGLGWVVPRALELCPPAEDVYYDQVAQIEGVDWSLGRAVLIGDACQAVSLLAGQGASLGIAGAFVLAEELSRNNDSVPAALRAYEKSWRPVIAEKQQVARSAAGWFLPASQNRLVMRRVAMKLSRLPSVDRYIARSMVGKSSALIRELDAARP